MSLIKCSECGKDISSHAKVCPQCGAPQEELIYYSGIVNYGMKNKPHTVIIGSKCWQFDDEILSVEHISRIGMYSENEMYYTTVGRDTESIFVKSEVDKLSKVYQAARQSLMNR